MDWNQGPWGGGYPQEQPQWTLAAGMHPLPGMGGGMGGGLPPPQALPPLQHSIGLLPPPPQRDPGPAAPDLPESWERMINGNRDGADRDAAKDLGRQTGCVLSWFDEKGFGFIKPDREGIENVFVHVKALTDGDHLVEGDCVQYDENFDQRTQKYRAETVSGSRSRIAVKKALKKEKEGVSRITPSRSRSRDSRSRSGRRRRDSRRRSRDRRGRGKRGDSRKRRDSRDRRRSRRSRTRRGSADRRSKDRGDHNEQPQISAEDRVKQEMGMDQSMMMPPQQHYDPAQMGYPPQQQMW